MPVVSLSKIANMRDVERAVAIAVVERIASALECRKGDMLELTEVAADRPVLRF